MNTRAPDNLAPADRWRSRAICRRAEFADQRDLWFPASSETSAVQHAKAQCLRCPVIEACATWALERREEHGVWGALSEYDRRRIVRQCGTELDNPQVLARIVSLVVDVAYNEPPQKRRRITLHDAYQARTQPLDGGHTRWTIKSTNILVNNKPYSPMQLAFRIGHGRQADGLIRAVCGMAGCVTPAHLADAKMRREAEQAARQTRRRPARPTPQQTFKRWATPTGDGHTTWSGPGSYQHQGQRYTPKRLAFLVGHGRPPKGMVLASCKRADCVLPEHLTDEQQRTAPQFTSNARLAVAA